MNSARRGLSFGTVMSWVFLLSILFAYRAAGDLSAAENDVVDEFTYMSFGDEDPSISESSSNLHALTAPDDARLNESSLLRGAGLDDQSDQAKFIFDWGDGTTSETGFVDSGVNISESHNWSSEGVYDVKVRAEDIHGSSSNWSGPSGGDYSSEGNSCIWHSQI